ncbi:MAG: hypothetical protein ACLTLQ_10830 [[Clostridium] scindens]
MMPSTMTAPTIISIEFIRMVVPRFPIELLKEKLYRGTATRADITRVTRRLGDDIAKVYGFLPGSGRPLQSKE